MNDWLVFFSETFDRLIDLSETTRAGWISDLARAYAFFDITADPRWYSALAGACDLLARLTFVEVEAVAERALISLSIR